MMPLVSFIVTYHNEPEVFLLACLDSIRSLPLAEDEAEIIVVDDGKTLSFKGDLEGVVLIRQEQAGLSVARNTGIEAARGQYIQFVDADDCLIPDVYKDVLEQVKEKKADVILFKASAAPLPLSQSGALGNRRGLQFGHSPKGGAGGGFYLMHHNLRAAAWGYAFKRGILADLRFYPGLFHEDELFTPQLFLRAETLVELDAKAYFYRQHEGTITHSTSPEKVQKRLDDIRFILGELRSLGSPLFERRIRQLTVDYLQKTWTLTRSFRELRSRIKELRKEGFLPLPLRSYSLRYFLFSLVV